MRTRTCALGVFVVFVITNEARADLGGTLQQIAEAGSTLPAVSGADIVWSNFTTGSYDIYWSHDGGKASPLTNTPNDAEYFADIDHGTVVWMHTSASSGGDIVESTGAD